MDLRIAAGAAAGEPAIACRTGLPVRSTPEGRKPGEISSLSAGVREELLPSELGLLDLDRRYQSVDVRADIFCGSVTA